MLRFKKYIDLVEGSTEAAKEMEYVLVDAAGGDSGKTSYPNLEKAIKGKDPLELGKEILTKVDLLGKGGENKMSVSAKVNSKNWPDDGTPMWTGGNKTPKTDIIISSKKISLKKGSSQLMSGGIEESLSTFNVATRKTKGFDKFNDDLAIEIEQGIKDLMPAKLGDFMGGADIQKKGGTVYKKTKTKQGKIADVAAGSFTKDKILSAADKHNMKMKQKFRSFFDGNKAFYKEFVFEAMTGKVKFDDNEGTATHFLVVDFDGDGHLENVITSADAYVSKILQRVNPEVRFKSSAQTKKKTGKTGFYNFRSVVQLSYTAQSKAVKEVYDMVDSGELQYLSEGFFDAIKRAWNKAKTFIKNLWDKVKKWISSSVNRMMDFLEIKPQITMTNEITW